MVNLKKESIMKDSGLNTDSNVEKKSEKTMLKVIIVVVVVLILAVYPVMLGFFNVFNVARTY